MVAWVTWQKAGPYCVTSAHVHPGAAAATPPPQGRTRWGLPQFPGYSKTAAAPIPVPMHMDTTPYALGKQDYVGWAKAPRASPQTSGRADPRLPT